MQLFFLCFVFCVLWWIINGFGGFMKIKYFIRTSFLLCVALVLFQSSFIFASENTDVIRIGYIPYDDLVDDINHVGNEGYGYEVLRKVEEISDFQFEFVAIEDDIFLALERGEVDIIGFYFLTPERAEKYIYLETPLNAVQTSLVAPGEENRIYNDPQSIDGKTVATYHGNVANVYMAQYADEHNISVNFVYDDFHNYQELEADYYLVYSSDTEMGEYNNVVNFQKHNAYLLAMPDKQEMMDRLNAVILEIVTTEGDFFEELGEKYMGEAHHIFHRSLTAEELETLQARTFTVAYNEIARPLNYTNSEGNPDGALIDVMNRLAEIYEFDVEYIPYSHLNSASVLENCDIDLAAVGDMEYYNTHFTPSETYFQIPLIAMVPRENVTGKLTSEDIRLLSPRIGILKYLHTDYTIFLDNAEDNELVFYEDMNELLDAYQNSEVDIIVISQSSLAYAMSYFGRNDSFTLSAGFALGIRLNIANDIADTYVPIFNIMLDNISDFEYAEILTQNEANHFYEQGIQDLLIENWYYIALLMFLVLSFFLFIAYSAQRKRREELQQAYERDRLTSLLTLRKLMSEAKKKIKIAEDNTYELITFDIDMFKSINVHFGEEQGTQVLLNVARALEEAFKDFEVLLCRKVDDQFVIVRRIDEGGLIEDICEKYIAPSIQQVVGEKYNLSLSFGIVPLSDRNGQLSMYLAQAENARKQSKVEHKTNFVRFDDAMKKYYENKLNVTYRMKEAMSNREFALVYQPKINFNTLKVDGAEALVRWFPKEGRTIFPDEFIPVFEQNGFILSLDLYVLEEVCKFIKENNQKMEIPKISVNLSAYSIVAEDLIAHIAEIIDIYDINPKQIEFELTESAVERDPKLFLDVVQELKECGFSVSIDDFGAGVSSLNRISTIEAHVLKLDKAFFNVEGKEEKNRLVVSNVIRMAKDLNMMVVSEGVETKEQALWLREIKSDYAQGYYFAKPMDEESFKELLQENKVYSLD